MTSINMSKVQIPAPENANEAHTDVIYALQIHGKHMVTGSKDTTIRRWDLETGRLIAPVIRGTDKSVICLDFDDRPSQDVLIAGGADSALRAYKFSTGEEIARVELAHAQDEGMLSLAFDESWVVTCGKDKKVKVWNRHQINDMMALPRTSQRAAGEADTDIIKPYSRISEYAVHQAAVNTVQLHRDHIVAGSGDRTIHVLSLQTGETLRTFRAAAGVADLHYNGRLLLAGSSDGSFTIWDVKSETMRARIEGPRTVVRAVDAVSDDGGEFTRLAIGKYNGTVQVYERDDSEAWVVKTTLEYGVQPERISDENSYVHTYEEGERVFDVCFRGDQVFCCGQGNVVVGWTLPEAL